MFCQGSWSNLIEVFGGVVEVNETALQGLRWKDLGESPQFGRIATVAKSEEDAAVRVVVIDTPEDAPPAAYKPHTHLHGEVFLVLTGEVESEGLHVKAGEFGLFGPNTTHRPTTIGRTVIMVFWTKGIELVD